ncbi:MAG: DUF4250 domain-containing protein [bacterium]|nr:DUF4250 domain-containing protein [bacterium]
MSASIPNDPVILLSYLNTQLRDHYSSLSELCDDRNLDMDAIVQKISGINYVYDAGKNQFI